MEILDSYLDKARHNIIVTTSLYQVLIFKTIFELSTAYSDSHIFNNGMVVSSLLIAQLIVH